MSSINWNICSWLRAKQRQTFLSSVYTVAFILSSFFLICGLMLAQFLFSLYPHSLINGNDIKLQKCETYWTGMRMCFWERLLSIHHPGQLCFLKAVKQFYLNSIFHIYAKKKCSHSCTLNDVKLIHEELLYNSSYNQTQEKEESDVCWTLNSCPNSPVNDFQINPSIHI